MPVQLRPELAGAAGEERISAELTRAGIRVAKPVWPFSPNDSGLQPTRMFVQGLKKKYVERNRGLCLALYRLETDAIGLIPGAQNIRDVYQSQARWNPKHRPHDQLPNGTDVRIALPVSDPVFDSKWLLPKTETASESSTDVAALQSSCR